LLRELLQVDATTFDALAATLAASSADHDDESARIALHHVHLPKLQDAVFVELDDDTVVSTVPDSLATQLDGTPSENGSKSREHV
jgi:hypothetical protein